METNVQSFDIENSLTSSFEGMYSSKICIKRSKFPFGLSYSQYSLLYTQCSTWLSSAFSTGLKYLGVCSRLFSSLIFLTALYLFSSLSFSAAASLNWPFSKCLWSVLKRVSVCGNWLLRYDGKWFNYKPWWLKPYMKVAFWGCEFLLNTNSVVVSSRSPLLYLVIYTWESQFPWILYRSSPLLSSSSLVLITYPST